MVITKTMKNIIVYSSEQCPHCTTLKNYLTSKGLAYEEKDVIKESVYKNELIKKGYRGVPVTIVDGMEIVGFDREQLDNILKR